MEVRYLPRAAIMKGSNARSKTRRHKLTPIYETRPDALENPLVEDMVGVGLLPGSYNGNIMVSKTTDGSSILSPGAI